MLSNIFNSSSSDLINNDTSTVKNQPIPEFVLRAHKNPVNSLSFFNLPKYLFFDEKYYLNNNTSVPEDFTIIPCLASADSSGLVYLWNLTKQRPIVCFLPHSESILSVIVPDECGGRICITQGKEGTVKIWDISILIEIGAESALMRDISDSFVKKQPLLVHRHDGVTETIGYGGGKTYINDLSDVDSGVAGLITSSKSTSPPDQLNYHNNINSDIENSNIIHNEDNDRNDIQDDTYEGDDGNYLYNDDLLTNDMYHDNIYDESCENDGNNYGDPYSVSDELGNDPYNSDLYSKSDPTNSHINSNSDFNTNSNTFTDCRHYLFSSSPYPPTISFDAAMPARLAVLKTNAYAFAKVSVSALYSHIDTRDSNNLTLIVTLLIAAPSEHASSLKLWGVSIKFKISQEIGVGYEKLTYLQQFMPQTPSISRLEVNMKSLDGVGVGSSVDLPPHCNIAHVLSLSSPHIHARLLQHIQLDHSNSETDQKHYGMVMNMTLKRVPHFETVLENDESSPKPHISRDTLITSIEGVLTEVMEDVNNQHMVENIKTSLTSMISNSIARLKEVTANQQKKPHARRMKDKVNKNEKPNFDIFEDVNLPENESDEDEPIDEVLNVELTGTSGLFMALKQRQTEEIEETPPPDLEKDMIRRDKIQAAVDALNMGICTNVDTGFDSDDLFEDEDEDDEGDSISEDHDVFDLNKTTCITTTRPLSPYVLVVATESGHVLIFNVSPRIPEVMAPISLYSPSLTSPTLVNAYIKFLLLQQYNNPYLQDIKNHHETVKSEKDIKKNLHLNMSISELASQMTKMNSVDMIIGSIPSETIKIAANNIQDYLFQHQHNFEDNSGTNTYSNTFRHPHDFLVSRSGEEVNYPLLTPYTRGLPLTPLSHHSLSCTLHSLHRQLSDQNDAIGVDEKTTHSILRVLSFLQSIISLSIDANTRGKSSINTDSFELSQRPHTTSLHTPSIDCSLLWQGKVVDHTIISVDVTLHPLSIPKLSTGLETAPVYLESGVGLHVIVGSAEAAVTSVLLGSHRKVTNLLPSTPKYYKIERHMAHHDRVNHYKNYKKLNSSSDFDCELLPVYSYSQLTGCTLLAHSHPTTNTTVLNAAMLPKPGYADEVVSSLNSLNAPTHSHSHSVIKTDQLPSARVLDRINASHYSTVGGYKLHSKLLQALYIYNSHTNTNTNTHSIASYLSILSTPLINMRKKGINSVCVTHGGVCVCVGGWDGRSRLLTGNASLAMTLLSIWNWWVSLCGELGYTEPPDNYVYGALVEIDSEGNLTQSEDTQEDHLENAIVKKTNKNKKKLTAENDLVVRLYTRLDSIVTNMSDDYILHTAKHLGMTGRSATSVPPSRLRTMLKSMIKNHQEEYISSGGDGDKNGVDPGMTKEIQDKMQMLGMDGKDTESMIAMMQQMSSQNPQEPGVGSNMELMKKALMAVQNKGNSDGGGSMLGNILREGDCIFDYFEAVYDIDPLALHNQPSLSSPSLSRLFSANGPHTMTPDKLATVSPIPSLTRALAAIIGANKDKKTSLSQSLQLAVKPIYDALQYHSPLSLLGLSLWSAYGDVDLTSDDGLDNKVNVNIPGGIAPKYPLKSVEAVMDVLFYLLRSPDLHDQLGSVRITVQQTFSNLLYKLNMAQKLYKKSIKSTLSEGGNDVKGTSTLADDPEDAIDLSIVNLTEYGFTRSHALELIECLVYARVSLSVDNRVKRVIERIQHQHRHQNQHQNQHQHNSQSNLKRDVDDIDDDIHGTTFSTSTPSTSSSSPSFSSPSFSSTRILSLLNVHLHLNNSTPLVLKIPSNAHHQLALLKYGSGSVSSVTELRITKQNHTDSETTKSSKNNVIHENHKIFPPEPVGTGILSTCTDDGAIALWHIE